jgi:hypothetical protein
MEARDAAIALARGRIGIGLVALAAPKLAARTMFGPSGSDARTAAFARMLAGRDLALGLGLEVAIDRGAPVRGWLEAGALADGVDLVASLLGKDALTPASRAGTALVAGAAALTGIALSRRLDLEPGA